MMTVTPFVRHIILKTVYAMRLSCRGAVGKANTTDCKNDKVSSWLLFLGGYRIWLNLLLCVTCNTAIIGDEATGTRSPFRELHSIAHRHRGCGGDCLFLAECCHHMKEVDNAQDTSDHDGR
jgi:hypothetical protein